MKKSVILMIIMLIILSGCNLSKYTNKYEKDGDSIILLHRDAWEILTNTERKEVIKDVISYECTYLGMKEPKIKFDNKTNDLYVYVREDTVVLSEKFLNQSKEGLEVMKLLLPKLYEYYHLEDIANIANERFLFYYDYLPTF